MMGFGHRVYKNFDPRAQVMRQTCHDVLDELGITDEPLLDLAMELSGSRWRMSISLRKVVSECRFLFGYNFQSQVFDVDVYRFVCRCATVGWIAQWNEMVEDPSQRIGRPRQLYLGEPARDYVMMNERK